MSEAKRNLVITSYPSPSGHAIKTHKALPKHILAESKHLKNVSLNSSRVVIIGPMCVGKTSICQRIANNTYSGQYKPTIGLDFVTLTCNIFGNNFGVFLWDTAGQERFRAMGKSYYKQSDCIIMCFNLNEEESAKQLLEWYQEVLNYSPPDVLIFIVGNQSDLPRRVHDEDIEELKRTIPGEYWECSAKLNENVTELINRVAILCYEKKVEEYLSHGNVSHGNVSHGNVSPELITAEQIKQSEPQKKKCCNW